MWARDSNSSDVTWNEASNYCSNLRLAGYSNWRLATSDELEGIFDETVDGKCRVKGGIRFHSFCSSWSNSRDSTRTRYASEVAFAYGFEGPPSVRTFDTSASHGTLCVRSGE